MSGSNLCNAGQASRKQGAANDYNKDNQFKLFECPAVPVWFGGVFPVSSALVFVFVDELGLEDAADEGIRLTVSREPQSHLAMSASSFRRTTTRRYSAGQVAVSEFRVAHF